MNRQKNKSENKPGISLRQRKAIFVFPVALSISWLMMMMSAPTVLNEATIVMLQAGILALLGIYLYRIPKPKGNEKWFA